MKRFIRNARRMFKAVATDPGVFGQVVNTVPLGCSAYEFSRAYADAARQAGDAAPPAANPLWDYFQNHKTGPGIYKWEHYFEAYHRHLAQFIGRKVDVLEIGIYRGGSLGMWRSYFGDKSRIYGVDIDPGCKTYENEHISVFIGDQGDRAFWGAFRKSVESIDVLIDDGGHTPEQQQTTLEEMLPHLRPGGVYVCEDIHGCFNRFTAFAAGLVHELNRINLIPGELHQTGVSPFQSCIHSIHFYPYLVVIEKHRVPPARLSAPRHGTEW